MMLILRFLYTSSLKNSTTFTPPEFLILFTTPSFVQVIPMQELQGMHDVQSTQIVIKDEIEFEISEFFLGLVERARICDFYETSQTEMTEIIEG